MARRPACCAGLAAGGLRACPTPPQVDAGGFEPEALASANITGAVRSVQNVLLAYEPGVAPRQGGTMAFEWDKLLRMEALPAMLQT